jgi:NAD(P)-dependent dehydrogenase (short-subunit alcohol dehydrogenase family)
MVKVGFQVEHFEGFIVLNCMRNYLIIGGSSGIGSALAAQLATTGNNVFASYFNNLQENTTNIQFFSLNVLDENLDLSFLPEQIHGVAYCPGSINLKPFARIKPDIFVEDYQLQVVGAIKVIQAILPRLKAASSASVVLFSTVAVQSGFNFHSIVSASKGAVEGLTKALAAEFAPSVRFNCIAPSITDTPLAKGILGNEEKKQASALRHPMKKVGEASDIANVAAFLLSEQSGWITGQIFHVDGGMSTLKV